MTPITAPRLTASRLRQISESFLKEHYPGGEIPIPIERIVEFRLGLDIVPVPGLLDEFDVDAFITSDLTEIRVDQFIQERRPNRYRFSLAHEVSHLLVHRDVFAQLKFTTIQEWKASICSIPEDQYGFIEWQAYELAGLVLVPAIPLRDVFQDNIKTAEKAGLDLASIDEDARRIVESNIGRFFQVSADVIRKRMQRDKLWETSR
jgi:hypothetical protein